MTASSKAYQEYLLNQKNLIDALADAPNSLRDTLSEFSSSSLLDPRVGGDSKERRLEC